MDAREEGLVVATILLERLVLGGETFGKDLFEGDAVLVREADEGLDGWVGGSHVGVGGHQGSTFEWLCIWLVLYRKRERKGREKEVEKKKNYLEEGELTKHKAHLPFY